MSRILITGATGNIGIEVIRFLMENDTSNEVIAAVRDIEKARRLFQEYDRLHYVHFDFENPTTFKKATQHVDRVFLLRPPHLADVGKYFKPLMEMFKEQQIKEIIFLSVQGAEKSKVIPHNQIECLIKEFNFDFIFLRPSYFMQNLTTTLLDDIKFKRQIILPSGRAKFNWIDIENIGEACLILLNRFPEFKNHEIEITGDENENFSKVVGLINESITRPIRFRSVNPWTYYQIKKKDGMAKGLILVMIMLHFLPRFQKEPKISDFYARLTGKKPTTLADFIWREKEIFE
jgi:uncharacterized protein YbjT (DUF2867 family)